MIKAGNKTMALEFLSNAWRTSSERCSCVVRVHGKEINYSDVAINRLFRFSVPEVCELKRKQDGVHDLTMEQREAIKSQLSVPNSPWVNPPRNHLPPCFKTARLLDIP
jgi:hypothetical protein